MVDLMKLQLFFTIFLLVSFAPSSSAYFNITYNGFSPSSSPLALNGTAKITPNGIIQLTNSNTTTVQQIGQACHPDPIPFRNSSSYSSYDFSASFVFAIRSEVPHQSSDGMAFFLVQHKDIREPAAGKYLGLFNNKTVGHRRNHLIAVEFDTVQNREFNDINDNHVGIDFNGLDSNASDTAGYYTEDGSFQNVSLISGNPMQVWIEYSSKRHQINVTLAPVDVPKPKKPLLSLHADVPHQLSETMYIGFSAATGSVQTSHYILGWSFQMNGTAQALDLSQLPKLPQFGSNQKLKFLTIHLSYKWLLLVPLAVLMFITIAVLGHCLRTRKKFAVEVLEDWESEYGPHRFKYKDLYIATNGFGSKELLGSGGFGRVYRGVLPGSKVEVAVKRVSHESRQGIKEFVSEISSIGRLRHRNLVPLLGYCRLKGELMLVYEYMPNGSLDRFLYNQPISKPEQTLTWKQRFQVIKGVASGLFYLHEGWEQLVIHRDVKAGNVLLDEKFGSKLGDFGLSRLYDHGSDPQTTHVMGTFGYLAPEHNRTGKATTWTDVYAFGAFLLEVVCGRRPIEPRARPEDSILLDRVVCLWNKGEVFEVVDAKMGEYDAKEVEMVVRLGLLCSHCEPDRRPSMRQVVMCLDGALALPELPSVDVSAVGLRFGSEDGFSGFVHSFSSNSVEKGYSQVSCGSHSVLFEGR